MTVTMLIYLFHENYVVKVLWEQIKFLFQPKTLNAI